MWNPLKTREGEDWPNGRQAMVLIFGGVALAIGGCAGWAVTFEGGFKVMRVFAWLLAAGFFAGLLAIFVGAGLSMIVFFKFLSAGPRK